jgi:hypothetical protein
MKIDRRTLLVIVLILSAIVMVSGHDGWGWLIFIAILIA